MASSDTVLESLESTQITPVKLCTFCNNSTNGYDKWLYVTEQDRSPFFPVLGTIRGKNTIYDESRKALVCIACFHHLLRQWSSFDRRRVPLQKREYSLVTGMLLVAEDFSIAMNKNCSYDLIQVLQLS